VRLFFKHFPLAKHASARRAAAAAICAAPEHKFWEMHDLLFENQKQLAEDDLDRYAVRLGLDGSRFKACRNDSGTSAVIDADIKQGEALGVNGTPTFYFGMIQSGGLQVTDVLEGARSVQDFTTILDRLLSPGT
jgi:protein-disulfide isomerase